MAEHVLGAQLYSVRKFTQTIEDVAETFRKVAGIGYTAAQISAFGPVDVKEVATLAEDSGITIAATHVAWDRFLNELDDVVEEHKLWGCVHPAIGGLAEEYRSEDGLKRFIDELGPVSDRLVKEGMDFSYHNHSQELVRYGEKTWLDMLLARTDPGALKFEIDTYWIQHGGGDPVMWIRKCAGREPLLHLKDMAITAEREQRYAEIGEGNLNWPAILEAAVEGGVRWYLVEQDDTYDRDPFDALAISYRNLSAMGLS